MSSVSLIKTEDSRHFDQRHCQPSNQKNYSLEFLEELLVFITRYQKHTKKKRKKKRKEIGQCSATLTSYLVNDSGMIS